MKYRSRIERTEQEIPNCRAVIEQKEEGRNKEWSKIDGGMWTDERNAKIDARNLLAMYKEV